MIRQQCHLHLIVSLLMIKLRSPGPMRSRLISWSRLNGNAFAVISAKTNLNSQGQKLHFVFLWILCFFSSTCCLSQVFFSSYYIIIPFTWCWTLHRHAHSAQIEILYQTSDVNVRRWLTWSSHTWKTLWDELCSTCPPVTVAKSDRLALLSAHSCHRSQHAWHAR